MTYAEVIHKGAVIHIHQEDDPRPYISVTINRNYYSLVYVPRGSSYDDMLRAGIASADALLGAWAESVRPMQTSV